MVGRGLDVIDGLETIFVAMRLVFGKIAADSGSLTAETSEIVETFRAMVTGVTNMYNKIRSISEF